MPFTPTAGRHRHKLGPANPRVIEIMASVEVKIGDILIRNPANRRYAIPVSSLAWTTDLATTRAAAVADFLGVSNQYVSATQINRRCRYATTGVYEMDLPSGAAALNAGDMLGPADSGSSSLLRQTVSVVTSVLHHIGRVYEYTPANSAKVYMEIISKLHFGGPAT